MNNFLILWIVIAIAALLIDIFTSSFFFVWFTIGAVAAIFAQVLGYSIIVQSIVFLIASSLSIVIGYPIVKKNIKATVKPTLLREQTYIGKEFIVDENMIDNKTIRIDGVLWSLENIGEKVLKGDKVTVVRLRGNKILVKKINK
ncbi:NfeD family protein [Clostridium sp. JN-1]|uniref:NfeD family protein n=1 Tax=Clostridium sp. JN-1 TaxID=2483110 RepID=UPI000F0B703B|nr:NfeD family protein [Clostridium sp. JN-1]